MLKFGELLFRYRDYTPLPWIVVIVIYCQINLTSLIVGCLLIIFGESIRIYGVAFIGGVSRTKTTSTGQKVIKNGPFAHVRNPLYLGNLLLSSGFVILSNVDFGITSQDHRFFLLFFLLFFFLQYIPIVNWEENNLYSIFGEEYEIYLASVPRWIPSLSPQIATTKEREQIDKKYVNAFKSERNTLFSITVLTILLLWRGGYLLG